MGNDLMVRQQGFALTSKEFETMQRMAKAMVASNYFSDVKDVAQAIVKIQAGSEIGIPPFAALTGIHIIKNKPVLGANLIATLIKSDGRYDYQVSELSDTACTIHFFEGDDMVGESRFTIDDAKKAGLLNNPTWKNYPRNMLFARAISNGARWYTPGIFGGATVYTPDEMGVDTDEDGYVIDVTPERTVDTTTGEITEGEVIEFDDLQSASTPQANGTQDARGDTSPQAQAARAAKRPAANGTDPAGARTAAETKAALIAAAMDGSSEPASDKQLKYVRSSVSNLVESDADKAKLLLFHIYGVDSSSDLTGGQASALIDWIGATAANKYTPSEAAQLEAHRLLRAFEVEAGQQELAL